MQSLRARLIAGLLALTAAGLLVAGAVTYLERRSRQRLHSSISSTARAHDHRVATTTTDRVPARAAGARRT
jgi:hypothetical protein